MKYFKTGLFIVLSILVASCNGKYTNNEKILRADTLLYTIPDSAKKLLLSIPHPEKLSKADYAAWCLVFTHAQYKLYQEIKSDSLIRVSANYYENRNFPVQRGTAYYLLGCILQMNGNNKESMWAYKKAEDVLKSTPEEDTKGLVELKIGYLYLIDEIFGQSLIKYKNSLKFFIRSKNTKYQAYAYRGIADIYTQLHYPLDSVMHYSDLALKRAKQAGDSLNYYAILGTQGELLFNTDYAHSIEYLMKGYHFFPSYLSTYAPFLSLAYSGLNKSDSAKHYLNISRSDSLSLNSKMIIYWAGSYVLRNEGNYQSAFKHLEKAYLIRDTIYQQTIRSQLYSIDKQYDLTQKEKENAALKILNQAKVIYISLLAIAVLILIFIISQVLNYNKKRILKIEMSNRLKQQSIEYKLQLKQTENEQKQKLLLTKLQSRISNTLFFNRLNMGYSRSDKQEDFMTKIIEQSVLSENDWQFYIDEVDQAFDKKITLLSSTYPELSQLDLIVVTLICLQVDISDSCSLLNMTKSTMYKRRNRIKERIGLEREKELEEWVKENIMNQVADK